MELPDQLLYSIAAAVVYGLAGYFKSSGESFDKKKFLTTVAIGVVVGIIMAYCKLSYEGAYNFALSAGIIAIVENVLKAIWRRGIKRQPKVEVVQPLAK